MDRRCSLWCLCCCFMSQFSVECHHEDLYLGTQLGQYRGSMGSWWTVRCFKYDSMVVWYYKNLYVGRRCSLRCYSWLIPPLKMLYFGSQFSVICANLGEKPHFSCCFDPKNNAKRVLFCLGTPLCFFLCVISTIYAPRIPRPKYAKNHPFLNDWTPISTYFSASESHFGHF